MKIPIKNLYSDITHIPPSLDKKHLPSLDGLRCFSILCVIIGHVNEHNPPLHNSVLSYLFGGGQFGVYFFFVISGFIITTLLLKEKTRTGTISLKHFYLRRLLRIFPLAWSFLIVLIILNHYFRLEVPAKDFLRSFLFVENVNVPVSWYTNHYWSLSVEEQYYLLFPFILTRGIRTYLNVCFLFILLYFCKNIYAHFYPANAVAGYTTYLDFFFSIHILSILTGSLMAIFLFKDRSEPYRLGKRTVSLLCVLLIAVAFFAYHHPLLFGTTTLLSSCAIAAIVYILIKYPYGPVHDILNNKTVAYIGKLSFSLYIWQQIFTAYRPWAQQPISAGFILVNLLILGLVAWLSYNYFELPFLRLKERFK